MGGKQILMSLANLPHSQLNIFRALIISHPDPVPQYVCEKLKARRNRIPILLTWSENHGYLFI